MRESAQGEHAMATQTQESATQQQQNDETAVAREAKTARISLTGANTRLTVFAVRKKDGSAVTYVTTADSATKKTTRGMTQKHETFEDAKSAMAKQAAHAEKLGWSRASAGRRFVPKPDAFSSLPSVPKAKK
jgi:hypothetical protein